MAISTCPPTETSIEESNNAHIGSGSDMLRRAMQGRTVAKAVPHLAEILDNLPASAVVLEVGSGPGGITLDIAKRYPGLRVFGVDIDEKSLKLAQDALEASGISNLKYARGDGLNLQALKSTPDFQIVDAGCDLVYTHASVCHMPNQVLAIKQLRNACKPGATLSMVEGDAGLFFSWPPMPKMLSAFPLLSAAKGADLNLGRKLLAYSIEAGFQMDEVRRVFMHDTMSYKPEERAGILHGMTEMFEGLWRDHELVERAGAESVDIDTIRSELENWSSREGALLSFPSVAITLEKAAS